MENNVKEREQLKEYKVGNKYKDISIKSREKKKRNPKLKYLRIKKKEEE